MIQPRLPIRTTSLSTILNPCPTLPRPNSAPCAAHPSHPSPSSPHTFRPTCPSTVSDVVNPSPVSRRWAAIGSVTLSRPPAPPAARYLKEVLLTAVVPHSVWRSTWSGRIPQCAASCLKILPSWEAMLGPSVWSKRRLSSAVGAAAASSGGHSWAKWKQSYRLPVLT